MTVRVGINGFGRIGRNLFRAAQQRGADIDFVAVNDLGSLDTMAHLLKYDSILGILPQTIKATKTGIKVDDDEIKVLSVRNPAELPWGGWCCASTSRQPRIGPPSSTSSGPSTKRVLRRFKGAERP